MFFKGLGDDSTDTPGVTTDPSGMSVVTVTASRDASLPVWPLWLLLAVVGYMFLTEKKS